MAPPLAWAAKEILPLGCLSIVQEFAADKRDPHPVALLVKRFDAEWVDLNDYECIFTCLLAGLVGGRTSFGQMAPAMANSRESVCKTLSVTLDH